ncbi:MAG: polymer-forming cytoskeletal protein [Corticimicrobacter sp.]|uniref:bactofilin family protein n=1 Tax=Corticimicrobacter sp. TaxID=2678536 RepID=UPI0032DA266B
MFNKKRKRMLETTKLSSLIADNLAVNGDISFSGGLRVDGRIDGNVSGIDGEKNLIVISDKGSVIGRVSVYDAVVNGTITGDLVVEHFLELQANARITGNIVYRQLQMECGAVVEGRLERAEAAQEAKVIDLMAAGSAAG